MPNKANNNKMQEFQLREEEILNKSLELLLKLGDEKLTVEQIAEAVGVGKGTIYKHFESKAQIYLTLMIRYEQCLAKRLKEGIELANKGDKGATPRAYLQFRIEHAEQDYIFQCLEEKMLALGVEPEIMKELHSIRNENLASLAGMIQEGIDHGRLEDVPPSFHYCSTWALAQGAVCLKRSGFFSDRVEDMDALLEFIRDIGITLGDKGHRYQPVD